MYLKRILITFVIIVCCTLTGYLFYQQSKAQSGVTTISGKFYKLEILATNGQAGITAINFASINDFGTVAFNTNGGGLFIADGRTPLRNIATGNIRAPQINNNNLVITRAVAAGLSTGSLVRRDTTLPNSPATIIAGEAATAFPDFTLITDFPSINNNAQSAFSVVDTASGQTQVATNIRPTFSRAAVVPGVLPETFPVVADTGSVLFRIGTNATPASQSIRLYPNYNLTGIIPVITQGSHYNGLGQRPGISDDGAIVVFYGNLTPAGATALQTTAGPGIFANYDIGLGFRNTVRIANRQVENFFGSAGNFDGVCDAPEQIGPPSMPPASQPQCVNGELGLDAAGNPLQFASFDQDARIGVVHQSLGAAGIEDDVFIVSFIGTPNAASAAPQYFSNQRGLWTVKVEVKREGTNLREKPSRPMSVVQVGDLIGMGNQITNITVHDPIALAASDASGATRVQRRPDHRVAFSATTQAGGSILVRGTHIDSDEDGLPDHWETSGIDFDQDGMVDLALNTVLSGDASTSAANPNRKDIYVEMDYMQETTGANPHTHQPGRRPDNSINLTIDPILQVRNAFSAAPVRNSDGSNGVTLHTFMGEAVPEVFALPFLYLNRPSAAAYDDFDDLKFGSNGATLGAPCGNGLNHGYFGTMAERGNTTTCPNVLGAKRLVFRYSIFAHRVSFPPTTPDLTSGVAEPGGNDFIVSLAVREPTIAGGPAVNDYEDIVNALVAPYNATTPTPNPVITFDSIFADYQAGTFMHELGHTLGLFHGGKDIINCKPNYLSVMSYSRQTNDRGLSTIDLPGIAPNVSVLSNRRLDYSRTPSLRLLNETSLLETAGVNGPSGERTLHGRPTTGATLISGTDGPIDWNNNATNDPGAISADVNFLPVNGGQCNNSPNQPSLESFDDWGNLRFNYFETINFADGNQRTALLDGKDPNLVEILNIGLGTSDIDNDAVVNINDNCIFAPNANQADSNGNGIGNVCDAATTILADLSLTIAESADPVSFNTPFNYIATIRNTGPSPSQSVTFTDTLPPNTTFVSVTPSQGSCTGTSSITCNLGTINSNATATVTIRVTPTARGRLDNYANAVSGTMAVPITADPIMINNSGSASTTITDSSVTYTVSGRVTDASNNGLAGVSITVSGGQTVLTNSTGNYSATVASGGTYTVTPARFGFAFSPSARTVAYIAANQIVDFVGTRAVTTTKRADFDGDGKTDVSVYRSSNNNSIILNSGNQTTSYIVWGLSTDKRVAGDFDGDGRADIAVFRPSDGSWYILQSSNGTLLSAQWGLGTDLPVPGDFDGDGKTDLAVFRPSNGTWLIRRSSDLTLLSTQWGANGDTPLVGDFDGDGKTDFTVFRPSNTNWYFLLSNGGTRQTQFGAATDKLVPADYDGDGKTDFGVWRPSTGYWITAPASEPNPSMNFTSFLFGTNGDVPVPGDYDGDGKDDRAVFRPSTATWYVSRSSDQVITFTTFGVSSDLPLPATYLP